MFTKLFFFPWGNPAILFSYIPRNPYLLELVRNLVAHGDARSEGETGEWSG